MKHVDQDSKQGLVAVSSTLLTEATGLSTLEESATTPKLFTPIQIGFMDLQHRVVHAPTSRYRADTNSVPLTPIVGKYYEQRARVPGTLLISEGTLISREAGGAPNIYALGRAANPEILDALGLPYVSASDVALLPSSIQSHTHPDRVPVVRRPSALTVRGMENYVQQYVRAAVNAVEKAGMDGVEIHAAGGYLIDQFLQDTSNDRADEYGGSVENRARFPLRVIEAVVQGIGEERTGVRISPWSTYQGMGMSDPRPTFAYFVKELKSRFPRLAYLHVQEARADGWNTVANVPEGVDNDFIREIWGNGVLVSSGGYDRELAIEVVETKGDVVAFGRHFIANPDLPFRLIKDVPLAKGDRGKYYACGSADPNGYTDYPFSKEFLAV
ncbi:hypothetical protein AAF712_010359 [Marasmius tenuissimus]|uniref:NADH:flavin oxidoreductase/NADH oxidase N-terminal domain-containing protein n=1 Tax=Marasmius tenuissimus TaxID=585030 RepID=A0ABR2ZNI9_9AGAR